MNKDCERCIKKSYEIGKLKGLNLDLQQQIAELRKQFEAETMEIMADYEKLARVHKGVLAELDGLKANAPKFKLGDTVFLTNFDRMEAEITKIKMCYIGKRVVTFYDWQQYDVSYELTELWDEDTFDDDDIDKTVFATQAEALAALEKMKEGECWFTL